MRPLLIEIEDVVRDLSRKIIQHKFRTTILRSPYLQIYHQETTQLLF